MLLNSQGYEEYRVDASTRARSRETYVARVFDEFCQVRVAEVEILGSGGLYTNDEGYTGPILA